MAGARDDLFHLQGRRAHNVIAHERPDLVSIKLLQAFDIIKIDNNMGAFQRSNFNAGNAENILVGIEFNRAVDGIVIGDGDADVQLPGIMGDFFD